MYIYNICGCICMYIYIVMYVYSDVKRLHTQKLLHGGVFAQRGFCTHTQAPLHTESFTQRSLYTEELLQTDAFTHRSFYAQRSLYTEELLHIDAFTQAFTQRSLYTAELLHTDAFTCKRFYMQKLLHTEAFTLRSFCKENPCTVWRCIMATFHQFCGKCCAQDRTTVLCEPAQSKCTWTCHKIIQEQFWVRILRGNAVPQELAKLAPQTSCEPAQSKCIASEFLISQFYTPVLDVRPSFRAKGGAVTHKIRISPHVCASYVRHARSLRRVDYVKALPHNVGA